MRIRIGTSGFAYAPWKGSFYPKDIDDEAMLRFYGGRFDAVEINNTFYRMPSPQVLEGWAKDVPGGFSFALKTPRYIGPTAKESEKGDPIEAFYERTAVLGDKLGPALVQLAPFLKKKDLGLLGAFLDRFPKGRRLVIEFRNPAWYAEDVFDALRERNVALCVTDADDLATPVVRTADFAYFRLRRVTYAPKDVVAWAKKIRALGGEEAFVFFKHEDAGTGPRLAAELRTICGPQVPKKP